MTFGEAIRLTRILLNDPSSHVCSSVERWSHALPWEAIILSDLVDIQVAKASKRKPKPYPRPWNVRAKTMGTAMSIAELEATIARVRATS